MSDTIYPLSGPKYALEGKVVTMDDDFTVLERGIVYIDASQIVAVQTADAPAPADFVDTPLIRTGDTIYPGLIELHNHLSYNILPTWQVPKLYTNRSQWGRHRDYRKLISGPMGVLGRTSGYVEAIVRYVECKCLLGGVTTSQGVALYSNSGIRRYYRGIVRNVEETNDDALPEASTRIADIDANSAERFLERLQKKSCLLLHLSEGVDERARKHFQALQLTNGEWAITSALSGIHAAALTQADFAVLHEHDASIIWSPLSNLLLYGATADIEGAKAAGILMGIGSDWSPSGSKNLLGELKVAHLVSQEKGGIFSKRDILAMATINAAKILKWDETIGSIAPGKRADLLLINGRSGDPYDRLLKARETSITLVVINGVPRYGQPSLMGRFGEGTETWRVGRSRRLFNLAQATADPIVGALTLREAGEKLRDGLQRLAELALDLESTAIAVASGSVDPAQAQASWTLELDHAGVTGFAHRPHLSLSPGDEPIGLLEEGGLFNPSLANLFDPVAASLPLSELLEPIELDALTITDDNFLHRLVRQLNLPNYIKTGLPPLYGQEVILPESANFVRKAHNAVQSQLETTTNLATFLEMAGELTLTERQLLVDQALIMLDQIYVHLPLKQAMHAVDPTQRLKLLQYRLSQLTEAQLPAEYHFHNEMTDIFTSTRDLHTNYLLPSPFKERTAYLPFMVERYHENGHPQYILSKLATGFDHPSFKQGVEILYWNGVPIHRAIEINADDQAGSNPAARFARGLDALTIRPLVRMLPPDEEWVTITYRSRDGEIQEFRQEWLVFAPDTDMGVDPDAGNLEATILGFDLQTDAVNQTKKILYAPQAVAEEKQIAQARKTPVREAATTAMPTIFRTKDVKTKHGTFGYIRIFTFNVPDADAFVAEFVRLVQSLPQDGLIIDVRGNGGGLIYAAERLLQVLTPHHIQPERTQFINTPLVLEICRRHGPSPLSDDFSLKPWIESIAQAVETGATYSRGFPITSEVSCNTIGQKYYGPVVLITDALCYSATDIFAAGFKDHDIGKILGTSGNTGAGGANVWTQRLLQILMSNLVPPFQPSPDSPFRQLPGGAGMRVAVRRNLRVGERTGTPLEDLGVVPDEIHRMTKRDLLEGNDDLINHAGKLLSDKPMRLLAVNVSSVTARTIRISITTKNINRLDILLDGRPLRTVDVGDGTRRFSVSRQEPGEALLELQGFDGSNLVANSRHQFPG